MKELSDNEIRDLFGELSQGEAAVSSGGWSNIAGNIARPGLWKLGLAHLNLFSLAIPGLILSGIFTAILIPSPEKSKINGKAGKIVSSGVEGKENNPYTGYTGISPIVKNEKTKAPDKCQTNKNNGDQRKPSLSISSGQDESNDVSGATSEEKSDSLKGKPELSLSEALSRTGKEGIASFAQDVCKDTVLTAQKAVPDNSEPASGNSEKSPEGKKIIIFEEDTLIKVDTVILRKGKRRKASRHEGFIY